MTRGDGSTSPAQAARRAYRQRNWQKAMELYGDCSGLEARDLESQGWSCLWAGAQEKVLDAFERAHQAYVEAGDPAGAARAALALCRSNWDRRNRAVADAWLARAAEHLEGLPLSEEHGLVAWQRGRFAGHAGDPATHERLAGKACEIGRQVESRDLQALGLLDRGACLVARGRIAEGMALIDQAAGFTAAGDLDPGTTGTVLCGVIYAFRCRGDWARAGEWTDLSNRWISRARIAYFPGLCRTHRSEVLRMQGAYEEAERESEAGVEVLLAASPQMAGFALTELGEVRRRRGDLTGAMEAFRRALELSWEPQPGLARLLLAQGDARSAHQSLERLFGSAMPTWLLEDMTHLLAARTTVALAAAEMETARLAARELEALAARTAAPSDLAAAAGAAGELALAEGDLPRAVDSLMVARCFWMELKAPYEVASTRVLLARALRMQGDETGSGIELQAAAGCFRRIGARRDLEESERLLAGSVARGAGPASPPAVPAPAAAFRREGDIWTVSVGDRHVGIKDTLGARYIARLLSQPGVEVLAADLASDDTRLPVTAAGDRLDTRAAGAYRRRLEALREELSTAESRRDAEAAAAAREEMEFLARELSAAYGIGGRARREGSRAERARQSVTKAIRKVIRKIDREQPEIGRLLSTTIRTGTFCCYEPDPRHPVTWTL